jgi:CheY-like chemotaxis protein
MEKETLTKIFEPFFTTKKLGQGTGLGLATIYGIVKQNEGFINAYSEPGEGTCFKLYIPRHNAEGAVTGRGQEPIEIRSGREIVLLVEDESSLLEICTAMLEQLGYHVLAVNGPVKAIRLAEEYNSPIDLLMTDVIMPDMNGQELQRRLNLLHPEMKCLFMSGYTANVIVHQGILEEGLHFLNKPFSIQDLATKLRSILDSDRPVKNPLTSPGRSRPAS